MASSVETVIRIRAGCSVRCTFCNRSPDRVGVLMEEACEPTFALAGANRAVIVAGDVLAPRIIPLVARLRAQGTSEIVAYAHPGVPDPSVLDPLKEAGLTGLLTLVPAADGPTLARLTRGTGSVRRLAALMDRAAQLGLAIELDLPVMAETFRQLPDTLRRACNRAPVRTAHLTFCAGAERGLPPPWDFRLALGPVQEAIEVARARAVHVQIENPVPPPCVLPLEQAESEMYPTLARPAEKTEQPFDACAACDLGPVCSPGLIHFAPSLELGPVRAPDTGMARAVAASAPDHVPPSTVELYLRRMSMDDLVARVSALRLQCMSPWSVLAIHDPSGYVAPCRSSLLRPEVQERMGDWRRTPVLELWNSDGMRAVRRAIASGQAQRTCRDHCPAFFGAAPTFEPPPALPASRVFFRNLALQMQEMIEGTEELRSLPTCLVVSPSLSCMNRCRMCHVHANAVPRGDMPEVVFKSVLELLPVLRDLSFAGAEPLLSSRFAELVRACDATTHPHLSLTLTTHGLLLEPALLKDMARARFNQIIVSVNAATPETYEWITGTTGGFTRVMQNIAALIETRFLSRPRIILSFVVMRSNWRELVAFVDMAVAMGVEFRLLPVEKNREGESIFTDREVLEGVVNVVAKELMPRARTYPATLATEVTVLLARLRQRLERGDFSPL